MKVKKCEMFAFGEMKQSLKLKHVRHLQEKLLFAGPANDSVNSNKQLTTALAFFNAQGFTQLFNSDLKKLQWSQIAL